MSADGRDRGVRRAMVELSRAAILARRRSVRLRHWVPPWAIRSLNRFRSQWSGVRSLYMPVRERCAYDNLFHCCVHKTGSIWIKSILTDLMTYRYAGRDFRLTDVYGRVVREVLA